MLACQVERSWRLTSEVAKPQVETAAIASRGAEPKRRAPWRHPSRNSRERGSTPGATASRELQCRPDRRRRLRTLVSGTTSQRRTLDGVELGLRAFRRRPGRGALGLRRYCRSGPRDSQALLLRIPGFVRVFEFHRELRETGPGVTVRARVIVSLVIASTSFAAADEPWTRPNRRNRPPRSRYQ